jgi:hypothetical protein
MVENIATWYHGAICALREHYTSYVDAPFNISNMEKKTWF